MSSQSPTGAVNALLLQLWSPQAAKRRTAARTFRRLKIPATGPQLLAALKEEVEDPRNWEIQYQLIMAVGECGHRDALPFLLERLQVKREETMVGVALGDAIVRLSRSHEHDAAPILKLVEGPHRDLIDGAFRAMAMLRMVPSTAERSAILRFADHLETDDPLRLWVAAAAAGWDGEEVKTFLDRCRRSSREDVRSAAESSAAKKYRKWMPL